MKKINNIFLIIKYLFSKNLKISFKSPQSSNLLLVDNIALDWIKEPILKEINYNYISTRPNQGGVFYLSFKVIFFFIIGFFKKLNLKTSYVFACIKCVKPKIILENIFDHNMAYIAKYFPKIKVIIISQGTWFYLSKRGIKYMGSSFPRDLGKIEINNLENLYILLWGQKDLDIFADYGVNKNNNKINLIKVGSYEGSYYSEIFNKKDLKYDLLFVSQIHFLYINSKNVLRRIAIKNHLIAAKLLLKYAKENNLKAGFLLRNREGFDKSEMQLISSINYKGKYFEIIKNKNKSVWKELFRSKVIFSLNSTVSHDAMALNKKTVLMPLSEKYIYKWSSNKFKNDKDFWKWTVEKRDYNNFKNIVDDIINLDQQKYEEIIKEKIHYICYSNENYSGYKYIRNLLKNFLN